MLKAKTALEINVDNLLQYLIKRTCGEIEAPGGHPFLPTVSPQQELDIMGEKWLFLADITSRMYSLYN